MTTKSSETTAKGEAGEAVKVKREDKRKSGFYDRSPFAVCMVGYDTDHDHRVSLGEEDVKAHPLYDVRVFDEPTAEDIDGAMVMGADHDPVPVVRERFQVRRFKAHYKKILKAAGFDVSDPDAFVEVECVIDGRHRTHSYRELAKLNERSGEPVIPLAVSLAKNLTDARKLALRIAKNGLRRDDSTIQKAELMADFCAIRIAEEREAGAEGAEKLTPKDFHKEAAAYFGCSIVAVRQWAELLTRHADVIAEVHSGGLTATLALEAFRKVPVVEQPAVLAKMKKSGVKQVDEAKALASGVSSGAPSTDDFGGAAAESTNDDDDDRDEADNDGAVGAPSKTRTPKANKEHKEQEVSATSLAEVKVDKALIRKLVDEHRAGRIELPEHFVNGLEFALARTVRVGGLTQALRILKVLA